MKKIVKRLIIFAVFVGVIVLLRYLNVVKYITLESVRQNITYLQEFVARNYLLSVSGYMFLYLIVMAFSMPVAAVMTITGGFLFGTIRGAVYANVGATLGSVVAFLLVRHTLGDAAQQRYKERLKTFNKEFASYGYLYLLSIRLIILFPPFVGNVLAGMANVSLTTFVWTTSIGMLPGAFVYAFAGQQIHTLKSVRDVLSTNVILAVSLLLILSLVPIIFRIIRGIRRKK